MGLKKKIKQSDGVDTYYHRILYMQVTPNQGVSIAVLSYLDADSRAQEQSGENMSVYKKAVTYEIPYNENITIKKAYKELIKMDVFADAEEL